MERYEKYKPSGIEWIGEVPEHWEKICLQYSADVFIDGDWIESPDISKDGIRYITTGNIGALQYKEQGDGFITEETFKRLNCSEVYPGDILISRLNEPIGRCCIIPDLQNRIVTSVDNVIYRPKQDVFDKQFVVYQMNCYPYTINANLLARGTTMHRISRSTLGKINLILPPLAEQEAIAAYLDARCADIDKVVATQEKRIALLKELKQSVITQAVTRGLNPDVKMKDSGVEWIGEVSEHWEVTKTLNVLAMPITDGPHETPILFEEGIPFISAEAVSGGFINFDLMRGYISEEYYKECCKKYIPKIHDIYMIKSGATTGRVAMVETDRIFTIWSPLAAFRANEEVMLPYYLYYMLKSDAYNKQVELAWTYGTQQNIGMRSLERLKVTIPTIEEQKAIVDYLDSYCGTIDRQIEAVTRQIDLLREYKQSLITEVVTGKRKIVN